MEQNRTSVIIPACNSAHCLDKALNTILAQTLAAGEIIVVNDGSTDATREIAQSYGERVVYLEQENRGQGAARNYGIEKASCEYLAFLDADDYWRPDFLARTTAFLDAHPEAVGVSTGLCTRLFDGTETIQPELLNQPNTPTEPFMLENFIQFYSEHDHIRTGAALMRRRVVAKAGGQREDLRISQDMEYWLYLATFGPWGFIPEPLWVGNSRQTGAKGGWLAKYRKRRKLCPTVEAWEERVRPRLRDEDFPFYKVIRNRVAAGYAHAKILGGDLPGARRIVHNYGFQFETGTVTRMLVLGDRFGWPAWRLACLTVHAKELVKAWQLSRHSDA